MGGSDSSTATQNSPITSVQLEPAKSEQPSQKSTPPTYEELGRRWTIAQQDYKDMDTACCIAGGIVLVLAVVILIMAGVLLVGYRGLESCVEKNNQYAAVARDRAANRTTIRRSGIPLSQLIRVVELHSAQFSKDFSAPDLRLEKYVAKLKQYIHTTSGLVAFVSEYYGEYQRMLAACQDASCPGASIYECETDTIHDSLEKMQIALKTHLDNFYNNVPDLKEQFGLDNSMEDNSYIMLERMKLTQLHAKSLDDLNLTISEVKLFKQLGVI